eukprot:COSAG01_NODE_60042_length_296_cov_4.243655_1_plen_62_part_10
MHSRGRRLGRRGCTGSRAPWAAAQRGVLVDVNWADKRTAIHYLRGLQRAVWDPAQQKAIRSA